MIRHAVVFLFVCGSTAFAQSAPEPAPASDVAKAKQEARKAKEEEHKPADPDTGKSTLSDETLGVLANPWEKRGIKFAATYVGEVLGNVDGGIKHGAVYEGRLNFAVDFNLQTIAGIQGLTAHANIFQIHGRGLSREYISNLALVSSIEALATTRLYEAWLEKELSGKSITLRVGQLAADTEFITTKYADTFINSTYGWPVITAVNLPSGGPSPPLAAVGARLKAEVTQQVTLLAAAFNGDPAGPGTDDPQSRNRYGLNFRVNDGVFSIGEVQYAFSQQKNAKGLPGSIKLGGWYHSGQFNDQYFADNGVSLASSLASQQPRQLHGNYGLYGVFEKLLIALPDGDGKRGVALFTRVSGSPSDRNLISFYADGGLSFLGPFASRPNDKLGVGVAVAKISDRARMLDQDYLAMQSPGRVVRDYEGLVTIGYLAEIKQGWTVLPNIQYVVHPGGGYVVPDGLPHPISRALVLAVRSVAKF